MCPWRYVPTSSKLFVASTSFSRPEFGATAAAAALLIRKKHPHHLPAACVWVVRVCVCAAKACSINAGELSIHKLLYVHEAKRHCIKNTIQCPNSPFPHPLICPPSTFKKVTLDFAGLKLTLQSALVESCVKYCHVRVSLKTGILSQLDKTGKSPKASQDSRRSAINEYLLLICPGALSIQTAVKRWTTAMLLWRKTAD